MWRPLFTAIGLTLVILGGECLIVEKAVFSLPKDREAPPTAATLPSYFPGSDYLIGDEPPPPPKKHEIIPPEWAPYALASAGAIVVLYSATLAKD